MDEQIVQKLRAVFDSRPEVKLVYLFGSRATGDTGPLSDYDFAVYADVAERKNAEKARFSLMDSVSRTLETDAVDVVMLNTLVSPEFKYEVITKGVLIFEREPFRVLVEPRILNEYFDFHAMLKRHELTRAA